MKIDQDCVTIREITYTDTPNIVKWRNTAFVNTNFIFREPFTTEIHEKWIRDKVETGSSIQYIIEVNNLPVGSIFLKDVDSANEKAEFGIFIGDEQYINKGVGTIATKLLLNKAFGCKKLHKIYLRVFANNQRALKSYEKNGFHQEAYLKDDVKIDGTFYDMILMAIFNKRST